MHAHASAFGCAHVQEHFQKQLAKFNANCREYYIQKSNTSYAGCLFVCGWVWAQAWAWAVASASALGGGGGGALLRLYFPTLLSSCTSVH